MAVTPVWQAAAPGYGANAGHANQFIGMHSAQFIYAGGTLRTSQATGNGFYTDSYTNLVSQTITTTSLQTSIGSIELQLNAVGGSPTLPLIPSLTVSLYADLVGAPTGSPLASTILNGNTVYSAPFWVPIPLYVAGLTPSTTYHLVTSMVGTSSHYYTWQRSNQTSGAAVSTNGTTWTNQSYGMLYKVYDSNGTGQLQYIYEDGGARWTQLSYNTNNTPATATEYTTGQGSSYLYSGRTFNYTTGVFTSLV